MGGGAKVPKFTAIGVGAPDAYGRERFKNSFKFLS